MGNLVGVGLKVFWEIFLVFIIRCELKWVFYVG